MISIFNESIYAESPVNSHAPERGFYYEKSHELIHLLQTEIDNRKNLKAKSMEHLTDPNGPNMIPDLANIVGSYLVDVLPKKPAEITAAAASQEEKKAMIEFLIFIFKTITLFRMNFAGFQRALTPGDMP